MQTQKRFSKMNKLKRKDSKKKPNYSCPLLNISDAIVLKFIENCSSYPLNKYVCVLHVLTICNMQYALCAALVECHHVKPILECAIVIYEQ